VGPHGERSIYGITKAVWLQHMPYLPFEYATEQPLLARICAVKHINLCAHEMSKAGIHPGVYELGACWNVGLAGFVKLHKLGVRVDYGVCIANLYGQP